MPTPVTGAPAASPAIGQVSGCALVWLGLAAEVAVVPSPPPNWPTITSDVGMLPPAKVRLFVRVIVRSWPVGTVITTGDHTVVLVVFAVVVFAAGFSAEQVAVPSATPPQL